MSLQSSRLTVVGQTPVSRRSNLASADKVAYPRWKMYFCKQNNGLQAFITLADIDTDVG